MFLSHVAAHSSKGIAEMLLHQLCYIGSTLFGSMFGFDGRWLSSQETEKLDPGVDPKRARKEQVIAIKYLPRPKLLTEVRRRGPSSAQGSQPGSGHAQWYQPHVNRGREALEPFYS